MATVAVATRRTVHYSTVQYSTLAQEGGRATRLLQQQQQQLLTLLQYSTVQYSTIQYSNGALHTVGLLARRQLMRKCVTRCRRGRRQGGGCGHTAPRVRKRLSAAAAATAALDPAEKQKTTVQ